MNINKKYIIIFGTLILLLVFITGAITYYKEKGEQAQIPDTKQHVLSLSQDYPTNPKELLDFIGFCKNSVFSDVEELRNKKVKQVACILTNESEEKPSGFSFPLFIPLESIFSLKPDNYLGISVDLKDVVREYDSLLLEEEKLYFCNISEPSWEDQLFVQLVPEQNLFFPEGGICCAGIEMENDHSINFSGFIPQAESLNIKHYLVNEQTVSDVMNKQSFSEIKDILSNYPIIWQMEKPITL